eukprot:10932180-Prorocentrum_lima.AAC.1
MTSSLVGSEMCIRDSLTTVGQYTPIQATLGYQPALLPDTGRGEAHCDDTCLLYTSEAADDM